MSAATELSAVVETKAGKIAGVDHGRHTSYLGIPFAKAPVGELRFCEPEHLPPWGDVREATEFGLSSIQTTSNIPGMAAEGPIDEDCLFLNIYTPAADAGKRPVLFWIHGGGFTLGSAGSALYNGGHLAERGDVVVVTINYRLGALGYVYLGNHGGNAWGASANNGQLDMIAALRWVEDNISGFGGDPGNVTIFGESAGASAVASLLAMPGAKGLFHKAILESGTAGNVRGTDEVAELTAAFLDELNLENAEQKALMAKSADEILNAQTNSSRRLSGPRRAAGYGPIRDGDTLPHIPLDAIHEGYAADIPVMIGTNRDESRLFTRMGNPNPDPIDDAELEKRVGYAIPEKAAAEVGKLIQTYRRSREGSLPSDNNDIVDAITSDVRFRIPGTRWASAQSEHQSDTYVYYFTWESPARRGALGACHALEMPFVFGTLDAPTQDRFAGTGPDAERLSINMMDAWLSFAKTGNPAHDGIGDWSAWNHDDRPTMIFDAECHLENAPRNEEWSAWDGII